MSGPERAETKLGPKAHRIAWLMFACGTTSLVAAHLAVEAVEFVELNYYIVSWWSLIVALEGWNALRGRALFLGRSWSWFFEICGISTLLWFVFEFYNFWLGNWYYVGQPPDTLWRQLGTFVAFATVLPGMWEVKRALDELLPASLDEGQKWTSSTPFYLFLASVALVGSVGPFVAPTWTFPLVWGGLWATVDLVEVRAGGPSFLAEMERGRYRNLVGWLLAGAVCGLVWEFWNSFALCKWIYTVPGLEQQRLFEMPLLGFLGFVPFAAMTWRLFESLYRRYQNWRTALRVVFWLVAALFSIAVRWGMVETTAVSIYPADVSEFVGWTDQQRERIRDQPSRRPHAVATALEDADIREKLEFLEYGGIWIESGNCLWESGIRGITQIREASTERLTDVITECRAGPREFWRRRVLDWQHRPLPHRN